MAIVKIDWPTSGTPAVPSAYTDQNANLLKASRGEGVSLTGWDDSTTAPDVAIGSVIFANDVYYGVTTADEAISTTGASSGTVYLAFDDTDSAEEFVWSNTAPTWSATKNGWYIGTFRFTGNMCVWDGASSFSSKAIFIKNTQEANNTTLGASGGINTDNVFVKNKKFSGTLNGSGILVVAHGLDSDNILNVAYSVGNPSVSGELISSISFSATVSVIAAFDATNVTITLGSGYSGEECRVLVSYEA